MPPDADRIDYNRPAKVAALLVCAWLLAASTAVAQVIATNPVTFVWNANPEPDVAGYRIVTDQTIHDVGSATSFTSTFPAGSHVAAVLAYNTAGLVSAPSSPPLAFVIAPQTGPSDPACAPPLGAHAPAIFPTSATITTGKPGSRSFLNYQLGGPDRVVEVAVQIDGIDQLPIGRATGPADDLKPFSGMWFTQPAIGTHTVGVRVVTAFGCTLTRLGPPLVVKP